MSYSRDRRDDRRPVVSPWEGGFPSASRPRVGGPGILGGAPQAQLALAGNLLGSLLGGSGANNLASSLALAQVLQGNTQSQVMPSSSGFGDRGRDSGIRTRLGRGSSPPRSRSFRRSRSRSRDRRGSRDDRRRNFPAPHKRVRSPQNRAAHEIYIGNYPQRYRENDLRKLFKDNGVTVKDIRMKSDGQKVFAFAETESKEEIEKAVKAMDSKEISGRRLRVRSAKDKDKDVSRRSPSPKKPPPKKPRELRESDVTNHLAFAFVEFLDRQAETEGIQDETKESLSVAKTAIIKAFNLPQDESLKIKRRLETIFYQNNRRDIKPPAEPTVEEEPEKEENNEKEVKPESEEEPVMKAEEDDLDDNNIDQNIEFEEDDDNGDWKRQKMSNTDDEDESVTKDLPSETDQLELESGTADDSVKEESFEHLDESESVDDVAAPEDKPEEDKADENEAEDVADNDEEEEEQAKTSTRGRGRGGRARRSRGRRP